MKFKPTEKCKKVMWVAALLMTLMLVAFTFYEDFKLSSATEKIETQIENGLIINENVGREFESLKKENKELYDSLKIYKEKISYLIQFEYKKNYKDTVWITKTKTVMTPQEKVVYVEKIKNDTTVRTYEYANEGNDSINYNLKIGSRVEPEWYALDMTVSDKFTIVNKQDGEHNKTEIRSENGGNLTNTLVYNKKQATRVMNKIAIGPSITYGYDFNSRRFAPTIGISVTYNLFGK